MEIVFFQTAWLLIWVKLKVLKVLFENWTKVHNMFLLIVSILTKLYKVPILNHIWYKRNTRFNKFPYIEMFVTRMLAPFLNNTITNLWIGYQLQSLITITSSYMFTDAAKTESFLNQPGFICLMACLNYGNTAGSWMDQAHICADKCKQDY